MEVRGEAQCEAGEGDLEVEAGGRLGGVVGALVIEVAGEVVEEAEDHEAEDSAQAEAVGEAAEEVVTRISQDLEDLEDVARNYDTRSFDRKRTQMCAQLGQRSLEAVTVRSPGRSSVRT